MPLSVLWVPFPHPVTTPTHRPPSEPPNEGDPWNEHHWPPVGRKQIVKDHEKKVKSWHIMMKKNNLKYIDLFVIESYSNHLYIYIIWIQKNDRNMDEDFIQNI